MSRIGKRPVPIPKGVDVTMKNDTITVRGSKGELSMRVHYTIAVEIGEEEVSLSKTQDSRTAAAMWGTTSRLIANMITGVSTGFTRKLELNGVGFRMAVKGKNLDMALGFSHPVVVIIPDDLTITIEGMALTVAGVDKQRVGQFAAQVRSLKPVEPYKGKGFRYDDEKVRRKEGKKAAA